MDNLIKVEGSESLKRNTVDSSIVNTDNGGFKKARMRKKQMVDSEAKINKLEMDINTISNTLSLILEKLS